MKGEQDKAIQNPGRKQVAKEGDSAELTKEPGPSASYLPRNGKSQFIQFLHSSPEESSSTSVCGVGQTGESITPHTEVVAFPTLLFGEILPSSSTLVLSGEKFQNSEAQSVVKPSVNFPTEEVKVVSRVMSSTMFERLFDGDFPEGKGHESNILAMAIELVVVQSLASLRGDVQPTLLEQDEKDEEEEVPFVWRRKGVRGADALTVGVPDQEAVKDVPDTKFNNEPAESERERERKRKRKMVESHTKGDKKRYTTRGEMQKMMRSAKAANEIQMERTRKRRRKGHLLEEPTSTPLLVGSSETKLDDIDVVVAKGRKEEEIERVKSKRGHKSMKKSPVKKESVSKRSTVKSKPTKGPGPRVQKQDKEKEMTREKRIVERKKQKVLNGRVFDPEILTEFEVEIFLDEETLGIILVPVKGIRSIKGCKPSSEFTKQATKHGDIKCASLPKKFLKEEYQLMFEFINKLSVPRTEKRIVASDVANLFLMENWMNLRKSIFLL
ncbi:hypothetical protein H5410_035931 [Solanum commersonii]|uniref:Uncharacterized protein n=1 Tax=Solanum commersonii TaxID=4109 RepID=A0A9J5Y240_SOLCO|nr:hypothetical protein H5410_035931 [Solanum commersonii]